MGDFGSDLKSVVRVFEQSETGLRLPLPVTLQGGVLSHVGQLAQVGCQRFVFRNIDLLQVGMCGRKKKNCISL